MGLNDPFFIQYFRFVKNALVGDFGKSYTTGREVFAEIFARFPNTVVLAVLGIFISILYRNTCWNNFSNKTIFTYR